MITLTIIASVVDEFKKGAKRSHTNGLDELIVYN